MTARGFAAVCVPALLGAAAIGHATGGGVGGAPVIVAVEGRGERAATGFVVDGGRVVTVAHAVNDGRVRVRGSDGVARPAVLVRRDAALDLAVLSVSGVAGVRSFPAGGSRVLVRRGGAQFAEPAIVRRRIVARVRTGDGRLVGRRPAIELTADIRAGDSGAPLVQDGRVTGIIFARSRERAGVAYAVDASVLRRLVR